MEELREFTRDIGGIPHTFQMNKREAERRGLDWDKKPAETKKAAPANKAAKPADK